jgi:HlyD family secretion protein
VCGALARPLLFSPVVVANRNAPPPSRARIAPRTNEMKRLLIVALLLTLGLIAAVVLKLRDQRAELTGPPGGSGVIEGTDIDVAAQIAARVERVAVKKGDAVQTGQLLVVLDCADVDAAIAEANGRVGAAEAQLAGAGASKHAARRATGVAWAQASAAKSRGAAIETRKSIAERNVARLVQAGDGIAAATLDQTQAEAKSLELEQLAAVDTAKATEAQAAVAAAQGNAALAAELAAKANLETLKASQRRAQLLRRECEIHAPRPAVVEEIFLEPGEVAARGAPLMRLVDLQEVKLTFYLPNAEIGAVTKGRAATVTVDAYPSVRFSGKVSSIAMQAAFTPRNIQTRTDRDRLVYPIEVTIPNEQSRLRPGMPAEARLDIQ